MKQNLLLKIAFLLLLTNVPFRGWCDLTIPLSGGLTITSMTIDGMSEYFLNCKTSIKRKQLKKYNFFGDPSLYIYGLNRFTGNQSVASNPATNPQILLSVIDTKLSIASIRESKIDNIYIYNSLGVLFAESKTTDIDISNWPNGVYVALVKMLDGQQIVEKFIVKH
ncbi:MAG: T9SS type A sorting domain-containing protein [Bacteroidales bacterium]|nr:T9SS type A sorting domain-containing protein [Bacteroidales bacterium]